MTVHPLRTWIFGGFCLLLVLVVFTYQSITPSDGARIDKGQEAWTSRGILLRSYSQSNGLQDNDLLVAIEGEPVVSLVERLFEPGVEPLEWTMGRTVLYQVSRNGEILDIPIRLGRQPLAEIWQRIGASCFMLGSPSCWEPLSSCAVQKTRPLQAPLYGE
jgi:hypothetical protein